MVSVRPATPDDAATILTLVRELADYERAPDAVVATEASFRQHGFGERSMFQALMADRDGKVAGFALYFFGFSTWTGTPVPPPGGSCSCGPSNGRRASASRS